MSSQSLIERYDAILAPYAVKNTGDHGREFDEPGMETKLPFQRDRDRVIHSRAFRRLKHKTQVLVSPKDDHYRDRLTHTLEGAQIARSICRVLQLNEDLAEATMLAHDLGHPPFGHEGEAALNEMLEPLGCEFDHNQQGLRIVTKLENNYPNFPGLNLTKETRAGLQKHQTPWKNPDYTIPHHSSIEAQIVDLADEIAYYAHDIDDGLRAKMFSIEDLKNTQIGRSAIEIIAKRYPKFTKTHHRIYQAQLVRSIIHLLIIDILDVTKNNLELLNIKSLEDVYNYPQQIAHHSEAVFKQTQELRKFLVKNFYLSPTVKQYTQHGRHLLKELFTKLYEAPTLLPNLPKRFLESTDPKAIVLKDYIAGMTDNYAKDIVQRLRQKNNPHLR